MNDTFRLHPDAVARQQKEEAAQAEERQRKQEAVNANLRKQAMAEVMETVRLMKEMDPAYTVTADEIAAMVDDRVARMKGAP